MILPPPVSSVKLVEVEEANIHDGWVLVDDRAPAGVEIPHGFFDGTLPRRAVDVNLACAGGRVYDEAHEAARRRAQLVAEEQPCRLLGGDVTLAGTLEEDAPQDCLRLVGVVVRAADGPGEDVGGGGRPLLSFCLLYTSPSPRD